MPKIINTLNFLDFETGGLDCKKNAVCEVAIVAIKGDTLEKIDLLSTYVKPYGNFTYEDEAMKHTGITMADLETGMEVKEVCQAILDILRKGDFNPRNKGSKPFFLIHNLPFDIGFLIQIFVFTGMLKELEKVCFGKEDYYGNWQPVGMDTQLFFKMAFGADEDITNFKLASCLAKAGVNLNDAHKAISDTVSLKDGIVKLTHKLRSSGMSVSGLGELKQSFRDHFQF